MNLTQFKKGQVPWNKGIEYTRMVGNKHAFRGDKRSNGQFRWEANNLLAHVNVCSVCGCEKVYSKNGRHNLITHHIDENIKNNDLSNLQKMCRSCHMNHHREAIFTAKIKKDICKKKN